ncbi:zinc finger protein 791-like, partial [Nilaparvata lugens]|uniref:zinc finger protein 791-like n=1 Tax=Nilaparvata lugens TaxID=108931 RepID=UPI00193D5765
MSECLLYWCAVCVSATPVQVEQSISNEGVNLMENECKDKERPSNKEITLPTAYVKLYRIGVLDRIARTLHQKQRSDDDYDDVDDDYEPLSADSGSESSAEEEEEGINEEMVGEGRVNCKTTSKKLHQCKFCAKSFSQTYLNVHMRTHTKEKPYQCTVCTK